MREAYRDQLDGITAELVEMIQLAGSAMDQATRALLEADLQLAEAVIAADDDIDALNARIESEAFDVLALQSPVARDLRELVAALRISVTVERMGDMARHVADVARRRYPAAAIPPELAPLVAEMGEVARKIVAKASDVVASRNVVVALELDHDDDRMDRLHRELFTLLLAPEWSHGVEAAVDVSLISRYYERFADHAVSVARRVVFLVTGESYEDVAEQLGEE